MCLGFDKKYEGLKILTVNTGWHEDIAGYEARYVAQGIAFAGLVFHCDSAVYARTPSRVPYFMCMVSTTISYQSGVRW